jgi:hypothetical protein
VHLLWAERPLPLSRVIHITKFESSLWEEGCKKAGKYKYILLRYTIRYCWAEEKDSYKSYGNFQGGREKLLTFI